MNLSAAALRLMAEKGLTLDDVAEIVAANECRDPTNAARQARHRARKKAGSNGVTVTGVTRVSNDRDILTFPDSPPNELSSESSPPPENEIQLTEEQVLEAYNAMAETAGLPKARMTPERRKKIKTFMKRHPVDDITEAIWAVPQSRFLCGENDRGWKADLDFLLEPKKFTRVLEGAYAH